MIYYNQIKTNLTVNNAILLKKLYKCSNNTTKYEFWCIIWFHIQKILFIIYMNDLPCYVDNSY